MKDDIHIVPVNDTKEHLTDGSPCPCDPIVKVEGAILIYIHRAWDNREVFEQAIEAMNEKP